MTLTLRSDSTTIVPIGSGLPRSIKSGRVQALKRRGYKHSIVKSLKFFSFDDLNDNLVIHFFRYLS